MVQQLAQLKIRILVGSVPVSGYRTDGGETKNRWASTGCMTRPAAGHGDAARMFSPCQTVLEIGPATPAHPPEYLLAAGARVVALSLPPGLQNRFEGDTNLSLVSWRYS